MLKFLKSFLIISLVLGILSAAFAFYTYFLVDYSLETLEQALSGTETSSDQASSSVNDIYRNMISDAALDEVISAGPDLKNLMMAETAFRSLDERFDRGGDKRTRVYLSEIIKRKKKNQGAIFRIQDSLKVYLAKISTFTQAFFRFFSREVSRRVHGDKDTSSEGARFIFLSKTQELERVGRYKDVIEGYRQYLKRYPESLDKGFVKISLSYALLRENRIREAERILKDVQAAYHGKMEARIAGQVLRRMTEMDKNSRKVDVLRQRRSSAADGNPREEIDLQLARLYMSLYRFSSAEPILKKLASSPNLMGVEAQFKLAWIYKNTQRLELAEQVCFNSLSRKGLSLDWQLGFYGQLADIYYRQKNKVKALEYYKKLHEKSKAEKGSDRVWEFLSAYEQANIYNFDLKDKAKAKEQLNLIKATAVEIELGDDFEDDFFSVEGTDLRSRAFRALAAREIGLAYELFSKNLRNNPSDAWTLAGLAVTLLMVGDLKEGASYVERAYATEVDEYTTSMMGYIFGIKHEYLKAEALYEKALELNPEYVSARFNLGCMKIRLKKYDQAFELLGKLEGLQGLSSIMSAKILNNLGYLYWQKGDRKTALEKIEKAVKMEPNYVIGAANLKNITEKVLAPSADDNTLIE